jgi:hypothetical protein
VSEREQAIRRVRDAAKRREAASIAGREPDKEMGKCCQDALRAGVPVTQIAAEAGLTGEVVEDLVGDRR